MAIIDSRFAQLRLKHLLLLNLIDESRSISKAANALNLTQPAVSIMLKELEAVFRATLVARTRQGAALTNAGKAARDRFYIALNELQAIQNANIKGVAGNHLRVGILPVAMVELVPLSIERLLNTDPGLTLEFFEGTVPDVIRDVLENKLDCAIGRMDTTNFTPEDIQELSFVPLMPMFLSAACSVNNPLARKRKVSLQQLAQQDWVLVPIGSQTRNAFDQAFIQNGIVPPAPLIESRSFFSNFLMVGSTHLLTLAPSVAIQRYAKLNIVSPIHCPPWPGSSSPLLFICKHEKIGLASIQQFQNALSTAAKQLTR